MGTLLKSPAECLIFKKALDKYTRLIQMEFSGEVIQKREEHLRAMQKEKKRPLLTESQVKRQKIEA